MTIIDDLLDDYAEFEAERERSKPPPSGIAYARGSDRLREYIRSLESKLDEVQKYWDDEKRRYDACDKAFRQVCDERDALASRLEASRSHVAALVDQVSTLTGRLGMLFRAAEAMRAELDYNINGLPVVKDGIEGQRRMSAAVQSYDTLIAQSPDIHAAGVEKHVHKYEDAGACQACECGAVLIPRDVLKGTGVLGE